MPPAFVTPAVPGMLASLSQRELPARSQRRRLRGGPARSARGAASARALFRDDSRDRAEHAAPDHASVEEEAAAARSRYEVDAERLTVDAEENMRGWVKTRGSLVPGEEVVFWWTGDIYGLVEDTRNVHLFSFEGYNIGRMIPVDGGWRLLTREVGVYRDAKTGEILEEGVKSWKNPYTGDMNEVVHIWNDPVNQQFLVRPEGPVGVPTTVSGEDTYWHAEVSLAYPSPLPASQFPRSSRGDTYHSLEMFQFFCKTKELANQLPSAGCQISWVRVGQWLPWMQMGDRPGRMVYHTRGKKLDGGYKDLPESVREFVERSHPEYSAAPTNISGPNETSWTYFKKLLAAKGTPRADGTIAAPQEQPANLLSRETQEQSLSDDPPEKKSLTLAELGAFNGENVDAPIYISLGGRIFDVSSAKQHYRRGETYNCLTGRDATCAFVSGDLSEDGLAKAFPGARDPLTAEQKKNLDHWTAFFAKTYPEVGVLVL